MKKTKCLKSSTIAFLIIAIIGAVVFLSPLHSYAQSSDYKNIKVEKVQKNIDTAIVHQTYEKIAEKYTSSDFEYDEEKLQYATWWSRFSRKVQDFFSKIFSNSTYWKFEDIVYYFLVIIGLAALIFIIYKLVLSGHSPRFKEDKKEEESEADWIRKNIREIDIRPFLQKALKENDFNTAIRFLFLINLKKLIDTEKINWNEQKTNHDFVLELQDSNLEKGFKETLKIYDYAWFGDFAINEKQFAEYQQLFEQFNRLIV